MDIELEKLKKLEHALCDAIDILRDWQVEEVKQECPCADGIDSKACAGCEHSEDGKPEADKMPPTWTNPHDCNGCLYEKQSGMEEPCSDCFSKRLFTPKEKKYRPYESSAEMIADFTARFKVNCQSYCEPLIWVKRKDGVERVLIIKFGEVLVALENDTYWDMEELLEQYTYLDGSPCGMEVKE